MFGIGPTELIVILVVALLILGPKRLPEIARSLGKGFAEFKRASNELRSQIDISADVPPSPPPPVQPSIQSQSEEQAGPADAATTEDPKPARVRETENRLKENLSIWDKTDEPEPEASAPIEDDAEAETEKEDSGAD